MKYKIVADSSANLKAIDTIDFSSVPLKIVTDNREYVDDESLKLEDMISELQSYKGRSGTSCPNALEWEEAFGDADVVFGVSITSGLSGSYTAAMVAKEAYEEKHPGAKVHIIDSLSAGPELELIIEFLRDLMIKGESFEVIKEKVEEYMKHTHLLFSLASLNNLAKNGRVNQIVAAAVGVLGLRIVGKASDAGQLEPINKARGEKKAYATIFKEMKKLGYKGGKVRISHTFNEAGAKSLVDIIKSEFPDSDVVYKENSALCAFYSEKDGLLVGYEGE